MIAQLHFCRIREECHVEAKPCYTLSNSPTTAPGEDASLFKVVRELTYDVNNLLALKYVILQDGLCKVLAGGRLGGTLTRSCEIPLEGGARDEINAQSLSMARNPGKNASVEIRFAPNADLICAVRRFVSTFYEDVLGDPVLASRMALATHELLENAVKYSIDGETRTLLEVTSEPRAAVSVCTWNRAGAEDISRLGEIFREMARQPDVGAYYQDVMRRSATRTEGSGLGLARIQAEAEMALSCSIDAGMVKIQAEIQLGGEAAR